MMGKFHVIAKQLHVRKTLHIASAILHFSRWFVTGGISCFLEVGLVE